MLGPDGISPLPRTPCLLQAFMAEGQSLRAVPLQCRSLHAAGIRARARPCFSVSPRLHFNTKLEQYQAPHFIASLQNIHQSIPFARILADSKLNYLPDRLCGSRLVVVELLMRPRQRRLPHRVKSTIPNQPRALSIKGKTQRSSSPVHLPATDALA